VVEGSLAPRLLLPLTKQLSGHPPARFYGSVEPAPLAGRRFGPGPVRLAQQDRALQGHLRGRQLVAGHAGERLPGPVQFMVGNERGGPNTCASCASTAACRSARGAARNGWPSAKNPNKAPRRLSGGEAS